MNMRYIYVVLISAILPVLLSGCYSQTLRMNENNLSGTVSYDITLHKDFQKIISGISDDFSSFDILDSALFNRNDMSRLIRSTGGTTLLQHTVSTDREGSRVSKAVIGFSEWNRMPAELGSYSFPVTFSREGLNVRCLFRLDLSIFGNADIIRERYSKLDNKSRLLVDTYARIVTLEYVIKTPKTILQVSGASLASDRRSVSLSATLFDLLNEEESVLSSILYKY
jgi:hypothetical protein